MADSARVIHDAFSTFQGMPIWHTGRHLLVRWDAASSGGWGGAVWDDPRVLQTVWNARMSGRQPPGGLPEPLARANGAFHERHSHLHINDKEALAATYVMVAFENILAGQVVLPQGDSVTANAAVTGFRGAVRAKIRNQVAKDLWAWAMRTRTTLLPVSYVNTADNEVADAESRMADNTDWTISDEAWRLVERAFGPHSWDRFADMHNTRCERFTARSRQPMCQWPDALTQPWATENNYACPPESRIHYVLCHVARQQDCHATIIMPDYVSTWTPILRTMEVARIALPPVSRAFRPGPSGHVEPWNKTGHGQPRRYVAVRVTTPNRERTTHHHSKHRHGC